MCAGAADVGVREHAQPPAQSAPRADGLHHLPQDAPRGQLCPRGLPLGYAEWACRSMQRVEKARARERESN